MVKTDIKAKVEYFFSKYPQTVYKKGELLLIPEEQQGAFFLQSGFVREYSISKNGIELTVHIFSPYSYFPMTWIISDIPNRYTYEALTDTKVHIAPKKDVLEFLKKEPEVLFELTRRLLIGLDKLVFRAEGMLYNQADKKLISTLLYLAKHFGNVSEGKVQLSLHFTQRDIAAFAGISRETASREWKKLKKLDLIDLKNEFIVINNLLKLEKELVS